jgi:hypothetical protein
MSEIILNLNGVQLPARACGGCSGSSSDSRIRTDPEPQAAPETAATAAA